MNFVKINRCGYSETWDYEWFTSSQFARISDVRFACNQFKGTLSFTSFHRIRLFCAKVTLWFFFNCKMLFLFLRAFCSFILLKLLIMVSLFFFYWRFLSKIQNWRFYVDGLSKHFFNVGFTPVIIYISNNGCLMLRTLLPILIYNIINVRVYWAGVGHVILLYYKVGFRIECASKA